MNKISKEEQRQLNVLRKFNAGKNPIYEDIIKLYKKIKKGIYTDEQCDEYNQAIRYLHESMQYFSFVKYCKNKNINIPWQEGKFND